jgi:O-antigen ligase
LAHALSLPHSDKRSAGRLTRASATVIAATLLLIAWGTFAFGAVYPWAYTPLAIGCALVGVVGLLTGKRPVWATNRMLCAGLVGVALLCVLQSIPLSQAVLERVSPGTVDFLSRYQLGFNLTTDPETGAALPGTRHALSIAPNDTLRALALFGALAVFLAGLLRSLSRTGASRLARGIVMVGCVLALVGIVQKALLGDNAFTGMRIYGFWRPENLVSTPFGPYVNKNHFAGWMLMAIPIAIALALAQFERRDGRTSTARQLLLWLSEPEGGRALMWLVAALVMTLSLLMTGSRSGLGCLSAMLIGLALFSGRGRSRRTTLLTISLVLAAILLALQWAGRDARLERYVVDNESIRLRLDIWRMSAAIMSDFPLLGSGLNTFGTASILYQPPGVDMHYNEAHNDYVQLLVEGGIVVAVLVLVCLAGTVRAAIARFRAKDDGVDAYWIRVGAVAGLLAIGAQSAVEFSLQMPGNAALFVVLLALALYAPAPLAPPPFRTLNSARNDAE